MNTMNNLPDPPPVIDERHRRSPDETANAEDPDPDADMPAEEADEREKNG